MRITRCVCHDVSFAELVERAKREGLTFEQMRERGMCSNGCGLCEPYVRAAITTGQTEFTSILPPIRKSES